MGLRANYSWKKDKELSKSEINEKLWKTYLDMLADDKILFLIAVKRYFGCSKKRLIEFANYLEEIDQEFLQHVEDGRCADKLREEAEHYGLDFDSFYERETMEKWSRDMEVKRKHLINEVEAARMQQNMRAVRRMANS